MSCNLSVVNIVPDAHHDSIEDLNLTLVIEESNV